MFLVPLGETSINFDNYVAQNNLSQSHGSVPDLSPANGKFIPQTIFLSLCFLPTVLLTGFSDSEQPKETL